MKALALAVLLLGGCEACAAPVVEGGPVLRVTPSPLVRLQWAAMEVCVGRLEDIGRWSWFVVDAPSFREAGKAAQLAGLTVRDRRHIYLARAWAGEVGIVRHEILHALGMNHAPVFTFCGAAPVDGEWWYR